MHIRSFAADDANALADLFHASVREAGLRDYSPAQVEVWSPERPSPARYVRQAQGRIFLVAEDETGILGYGDLESDGHIDHLYCRPDRVGTGVGAALLTALEAAAAEAGMSRLHVEASEAARRLFERRGYMIEQRQIFERQGVAIHNYRMSKALG